MDFGGVSCLGELLAPHRSYLFIIGQTSSAFIHIGVSHKEISTDFGLLRRLNHAGMPFRGQDIQQEPHLVFYSQKDHLSLLPHFAGLALHDCLSPFSRFLRKHSRNGYRYNSDDV